MEQYRSENNEKYPDADFYVVRGGKTTRKIMIDHSTMEIPEGKLRGSLPWNILINGERWRCVKTGDVKGRTYDKIENIITGEQKVYERSVLLAFLRKNWKAWQKKLEKNIVELNNNCNLAQNQRREEGQKQMQFPKLDF